MVQLLADPVIIRAAAGLAAALPGTRRSGVSGIYNRNYG